MKTLNQLKAMGLLPITVTSTVINPDKWVYKNLDGHYWPFAPVLNYMEHLLLLDQYKPCQFFTHEGQLFEVILN